MKYAKIEALRSDIPLRQLCRAFGVSRSNHYAHRARHAAKVAKEAPIVEAMVAMHGDRYMRHYGSPRLTHALKRAGHHVNRKRVVRLMRENGLSARRKRRFIKTTDSAHHSPVATNLLKRDFSTGQKHRRWASDLTYLHTPLGTCYLASIIDIGTRKWVGYAVDTHMRTDLCTRALHMALVEEGAAPALHHSDRGSQYASDAYQATLDAHNITVSMSGKGNCYDNAVKESFFGTFKTEVGDTFLDVEDIEQQVFDFFNFYNRNRLHSTLDYMSPLQFEHHMDLQHQNVSLLT